MLIHYLHMSNISTKPIYRQCHGIHFTHHLFLVAYYLSQKLENAQGIGALLSFTVDFGNFVISKITVTQSLFGDYYTC